MTFLLTDFDSNQLSSIKSNLKSKFNINDPNISIKLLHELPYNNIYGYDFSSLAPPIYTDYWGLKDTSGINFVDELDSSVITELVASQHINPTVSFCDELSVAKQWLKHYDKNFTRVACDFEAYNLKLPHLNPLTMLSISWNLVKSTVIVFANDEIRDYVLNWLVTTDLKQVWHSGTFDLKFIKYHTGKLPKYVDDSQLLAATYKNHTNSDKRKSGLKLISGYLYSDWANDKSSFDLYDTSMNNTVKGLTYFGTNDSTKYNLALIKYAGIDTCATKFAWEKYAFEPPNPNHWISTTSAPKINSEQFNPRYYYEFIIKPAIPVVVEMIMNGQAIDLSKVDQLKSEVEEFNAKTLKEIAETPIVKQFQDAEDQVRIDKFLAPVYKALKKPTYSGYKNNIEMRTWIVNKYCKQSFNRLSAKRIKDLDHPIPELLVNKQFDHPDIVKAANEFEEYKCEQNNIKANRIDKINNPHKYIQIGFNPWNYQQLKRMWLSFGLESYKVSKETGEMSFDSQVLKDLSKTETGEIQKVLKQYLEVAQSKNMITQYIPKYYGSTVNGRLQYSLRILGTLSGRLSGKAGGGKLPEPDRHQLGANGVTQPVGHAVYGKTVKSMFIAPPNRILVAVDYNGLENHINACLTKDETTIKLLSPDEKTGLMWDMHTLHSTMFFQKEWKELHGKDFENTIEYNQMCYKLTQSDSKASSLRSKSKPITFKLA